MKTIIIGAGSDLGTQIDGSSLGPTQLLTDITSFYEGKTLEIKQDEELIKSRSISDFRKNFLEIEKFNSNLYKIILEQFRNNYFPITIGGDHSISIPTTLACSKAHSNIGLICLNSQLNFDTFDSTSTGNIQELTVAAIAGKNNDLTRYHDGNHIKHEKIVIIGVREINEEEKKNLNNANIYVFTIQDIKEQGIETILENAFKIASTRTNGIHISYGLNIIDPKEAPGISIPIDNGITSEEAIKINRIIAEHIDKITSYDLVEFNPTRDVNRKTEQLAVNLLSQIINAAEKKATYGSYKNKKSVKF